MATLIYPKLVVKYATVKATPVYTCAKCGATAEGGTVTIEIRNNEHLDKEVMSRRLSLSNNHLPVGWVGHGLGNVRCPLHGAVPKNNTQEETTCFCR